MLHSTGGFPSSHTSFVVSLITTLGMIQFHDLGYLDWSFSVALAFGILTLHDAMGVRYEATKHAIILNRLVATIPDDKKEALGLVNQPVLKELLGHKKYEVFAGAILGVAISMIGFAIAIACFQGYVNTPHMEAIKTTTKNLFNI
jgi:acid phosphatase family membrane protein YuiD